MRRADLSFVSFHLSSKRWKEGQERAHILAALSNLFITASPESVCRRVVKSRRSSSVRNFAVSGQSQTQNLAAMPTRTVKMPSIMKILYSEVSMFQERVMEEKATISSLSIHQYHPSLQERRREASWCQHQVIEAIFRHLHHQNHQRGYWQRRTMIGAIEVRNVDNTVQLACFFCGKWYSTTRP
jgi:hypothetical protein